MREQPVTTCPVPWAGLRYRCEAMHGNEPGHKPSPASAGESHLRETMHTVRVWQVAPIRTEWTAVLPVRAGREEEARQLVSELLANHPNMSGGPPRNAVGLLEPQAGRRGMRFNPSERAAWPKAALYLEFMPAGADMVYAHYDLAQHILESAAPLLEDALWYAILTQCEDILDRWEIASGRLLYDRRLTDENEAHAVLEAIEPALRGRVR